MAFWAKRGSFGFLAMTKRMGKRQNAQGAKAISFWYAVGDFGR